MGREISLFSDYHTAENSLTNYCGLILKLLYEENPESFQEVISALSSSTDFNIQPTFEQQVKKGESILDLLIEQKSFSIRFETKITDWFYEDQIHRHLAGFDSNPSCKILFLLSNFEGKDPNEKYESLIKEAKEKYDVILAAITFEDFINTLKSDNIRSSDTFKRFLSEFEYYLEHKNYFPSWKYKLDVVNSAASIDEILANNFYMCPNTGGAYSHRRAKYFGAYKNKTVQHIYEVDAVVAIERNEEDAKIEWKQSPQDDKSLIEKAKKKIAESPGRKEEIQRNGLLVFLLGDNIKTNFQKQSKGGMFGSKKYFDLKKLEMNNLNDLKRAIEKKQLKWDE
ncbi:MAG: hypothetical protein EZS26_001129 [Candidatus Ordinivivax streblomastigis]|uniref:Uncharacterized protein n=1 Tax=Candidatus Ordinivivax streblomastigis TaxID=2540710 RepID=A0A5M8P2Q3_9BACT|nr:MAG: hypothetical protein EZS26_001129 [Candidatus Ordinivivax streblomastigis]